jgi:hypothetical protein
MTLLEELQWRGLYADCTDSDALAKRLAEGPTTLYAGFDPTADSLHVGNLVPLFALRRFQLAGHVPIVLAGGATGMVGDPSGKSDERNLQTPEQVEHNIAAIKVQLQKFLDFQTTKKSAGENTWSMPWVVMIATRRKKWALRVRKSLRKGVSVVSPVKRKYRRQGMRKASGFCSCLILPLLSDRGECHSPPILRPTRPVSETGLKNSSFARCAKGNTKDFPVAVPSSLLCPGRLTDN